MKDSHYLIHHGWVDDATHDTAGGHRLRIRLADARLIEVGVASPIAALKLADEVGLVVAKDNPGHALVLVDYTTCEGHNFLSPPDHFWPNAVDAGIIVLTTALFAWTLHDIALVAVLAFISLYWLLTRWLPERRQRRRATHLDLLLDSAYANWRVQRRELQG